MLYMSTINSDEYDAEHGVRNGPEQLLAPEHRDKPGASFYQQNNLKKQGRVYERSRTEERASEPVCSGDEQSRPIFRNVRTARNCEF
ncbi:MAG: hypothetical protein A4E38_00150 [Methanoregulaceae archaeon PtaB.Bin108]|nr:MAG: hypothetical protein A4E38_00150 [Methanoregulaceae archaeon PtaB.Bin108]OPY41832.1 MAG: hypothetical protein A4E42_01716 [Methanoregulaceae archaeon PtaU1.Bin222]